MLADFDQAPTMTVNPSWGGWLPIDTTMGKVSRPMGSVRERLAID